VVPVNIVCSSESLAADDNVCKLGDNVWSAAGLQER
jgi:hypothetical protein